MAKPRSSQPPADAQKGARVLSSKGAGRGRERLIDEAPEGGGWLTWTEAPPGTEVLFRVEQSGDGRYHLSDLKMRGTVSANVLRSLPIGRLEAAANAFFHDVGEFTTVKDNRRRADGHAVDARISEDLRANAVQGYPDSFYDAVASLYRTLVVTSSRPIGELAEANGVPVTTAQRWVKEARRRGKLAPGRPGKSG